jgi:hypothetical protein
MIPTFRPCKLQYGRDHLEVPGSVWDFEHVVIRGARHFATVVDEPVYYRHVVEKGSWQVQAAQWFTRAGLTFTPGHRSQRPRLDYWHIAWGRAKFTAVGYAWMRVRRHRPSYGR